MTGDYYVRSQLVLLEINRLVVEADGAKLRGEFQRLDEILAEVALLYNNILEIRREQLAAGLTPPKKRRWWQREGTLA